jgi:hypothetical protein
MTLVPWWLPDLERATMQLDVFFTIGRPRPVPSYLRVNWLSIWPKRRQRDVHVLLLDADAGVVMMNSDAVVPRGWRV